ncbi:MAG: Ppx/GppA phosphatase family protein [Pseudomonadota bacterium]
MALSSQMMEERGRFMELKPVGVIDIGSNSVRLVVYEGAVRAITPLFNEKVVCGLGRNVAIDGTLGAEGMVLAFEALSRFRAILDTMGVRIIKPFATAAVRDASDGETFLKRGAKIIGAPIRVLSGSEEAELAAKGIQMAFCKPNGVVGDLGGGSLELLNVQNGGADHATSLGLGGLRLIEKSNGDIGKALSLIDRVLDKVEWLDIGAKRSFFMVGGTWRAFAKLHMERTSYPLHVMQGYRMSVDEALALAKELRTADPLSSVDAISTVSRSRREILPFGAAALERVLLRMKPKDVVTSVFGVREGLIYDMLPTNERRKDPLISFCTDYARLRSRSPEHAMELCSWTAPLFEKGDLAESSDERRLRHAACLLSDIAWRAHPDYRGEQSLNVVAHAALTGLGHQGRIFLALAIYHRHEGKNGNDLDGISNRMKKLISKRDQKRSKIIGLAIRAAHMLAVGMPGVVTRTPLSFEGDTLVLTIPKSLAALDGVRVKRRFQTLADAVGSPFEMRVGGQRVT